MAKKQSAAPSTKQLHQNIGHDLRVLTAAKPEPVSTEDEQRLGKLVVGLITASIKAEMPGRQSTAQVKTYLQDAQQAFARRLHRKAEALATPETDLATHNRAMGEIIGGMAQEPRS